VLHHAESTISLQGLLSYSDPKLREVPVAVDLLDVGRHGALDQGLRRPVLGPFLEMPVISPTTMPVRLGWEAKR